MLAITRHEQGVNYTEIKLFNKHESTIKSLNRDMASIKRLPPHLLILSRINFQQEFYSTVNILEDDRSYN